MAKSPFHQALHHWASHFKDRNVPLLHIDLHGKLDRKGNLHMDIGTAALKNFWSKGEKFQREFVESLEVHCKNCFSVGKT